VAGIVMRPFPAAFSRRAGQTRKPALRQQEPRDEAREGLVVERDQDHRADERAERAGNAEQDGRPPDRATSLR
jgi:hypothetical protein